MICPKCGTENLKGKLLCYKCGAKLLQAPGEAPQVGKKPARKRRFKALYYLFALIFSGVIFCIMLQRPEMEPLEVSPEAARSLEQKLYMVERAALAKKPLRVEVSEDELNSFVSRQFRELKVDEEYARKNIKVDDIQLRMEEEKLKSVVTMKVKGKLVYVSLAGKVALVNNSLTLKPDEVKIGKLPVPAKTVQRAMKRVEKKRGSLSFLDFPDGVRSIRIEEGKLIVETEIVAPVKEKAGRVKVPAVEIPKKEVPAPKEEPEKRVLTEEELEERRRRMEENEANSWLQVGDNFTNVGMYDSAIEYYQKVTNKYPESEQAKEARQRIEEIKSRLE
ncbi:hypothetical protein KAU86_00845 [bacterium]|nr:hypothetical protein [bacterium]MCK4436476.1 hypothetical protein [bacterium]